MKCGRCGKECKKVHVRCLGDNDGVDCVWEWQCPSEACYITPKPFWDGFGNEYGQWTKWIKVCNCNKISFAVDGKPAQFIAIEKGFAMTNRNVTLVWKGKEVFKVEWKKEPKAPKFPFTKMIIIAMASLVLNGCASTLEFLSDVDPNLTYNDQEKKWEQRQK